MRINFSGNIQTAILTVFLVGFSIPPAAAEDNHHKPISIKPSGKSVCLQMRISEAKRKNGALRYYRSIARQQKTGKFRSPDTPTQ